MSGVQRGPPLNGPSFRLGETLVRPLFACVVLRALSSCERLHFHDLEFTFECDFSMLTSIL
jgi:hypothetical protein